MAPWSDSEECKKQRRVGSYCEQLGDMHNRLERKDQRIAELEAAVKKHCFTYCVMGDNSQGYCFDEKDCPLYPYRRAE